jgi:hypothetical protein
MKLHPAIEKAARNYDVTPQCIEQYQAVFDKCADWHSPSNRHNDEYKMALTLHHLGLLDCMRVSRNRGGTFRGFTIMFKQAEGIA